MSLNATTLKNNIVSALEADPNFSNTLSSDAPATVKFVEILSEKIIDHFKAEAEVRTRLNLSLQTIFSVGVPVPTDGGTALQLAWITATAAFAKDDATGDPSGAFGGIT